MSPSCSTARPTSRCSRRAGRALRPHDRARAPARSALDRRRCHALRRAGSRPRCRSARRRARIGPRDLPPTRRTAARHRARRGSTRRPSSRGDRPRAWRRDSPSRWKDRSTFPSGSELCEPRSTGAIRRLTREPAHAPRNARRIQRRCIARGRARSGAGRGDVPRRPRGDRRLESRALGGGRRRSVRLSMLETVREHALANLEAERALDRATRATRGALPRARPRRRDRAHRSGAGILARAHSSLELDNITAALEWLLSADRAEDVLLRSHLRSSGSGEPMRDVTEARRWLSLGLEHDRSLPSDVRARSLRSLAYMAMGQSDWETAVPTARGGRRSVPRRWPDDR